MMHLALAILVSGTQQQPALIPGPRDSIYETPALEALVSRVSAANRRVPADLRSYSSRVETELSVVRVESDGRETVLQVEQVASDFFWRSDGGLLMQLRGYRSQMLGPSFSTLSFFEVPWAVPSLYGERLDLVRTDGPTYTEDGTLLVRRVLHPFATNRDDVYRFSGGDTVLTLRVPGRTIPIARIHVEPVRMPARPTLLFHGDIDVDVTRNHIVSMQGRLTMSNRPRSILDAFAQGVLYVGFESAEYDEQYWLPREQRFEIQAVSRLGDGRVLFRTVSRFLEVEPNEERALRLAATPDSFPSGRLIGGDDLGVLSSYGDWRLPIGELNAQATARDFDAYAPASLAESRGGPRLGLGARHFSHFVRVNPVEGVYTGLGLTLALGEAAPGLRVRGHAGWAWDEETVRGGAEVEQRTGEWSFSGRAERQLVHTHDFLYTIESEPDVAPLIGAESFSYLDRRSAALVARRFREGGFTWRMEVARVGDRGVLFDQPRAEPPAPAEEPFPPPEDALRAAVTGDYWRGRVEVRKNPSAGGFSLRPGLFLRLAYEGAGGGLEWQRVEAGAAVRRTFGRFTMSLSADGGALLTEEAPPQALFELGAISDVPGSDERTFAGDRAALGRAMVMYTLPLFGAPLRVGTLWLPAPAPSPSVGLRLGWTDASPGTLSRMERLDWHTSDGVRSALDLRMRFFGGGVSVGAARPLEREGKWEFVWGLVGGF
jgi:hypothetical protein